MPTYHDGDFSVKPILDTSNSHSKLTHESTDYAKAILNQYSNDQPYYRGADMNAYPNVVNLLYYNNQYRSFWWLGSQLSNRNPVVFNIDDTGYLNNYFGNVNTVFGVVVCIR